MTRRSFPNRLAATGRPDIPAPLLLVVCREKRILNIGRGRSMSHGADDEESVLRWFGGYQVEPYRYSGNIAEWRLNGNSLQAWEMVDVPAPGDTRLLEAAPPIPCPNHKAGHDIDDSLLVAEVARAVSGPRTRPRRVDVRRVTRL